MRNLTPKSRRLDARDRALVDLVVHRALKNWARESNTEITDEERSELVKDAILYAEAIRGTT